jgi:hypothetical protein
VSWCWRAGASYENYSSLFIQKMECAICLEEESGECTTLHCGHQFHTKCLLDAALRGHRYCSLCRKSMVEERRVESESEEDEYDPVQERRRFERGMRLVRSGKAPRELVEAAEGYRAAVEFRDRVVREERVVKQQAKVHINNIKRALRKMNREVPREVRDMMYSYIHMKRQSRQRFQAEQEVEFYYSTIAVNTR